MSSSSLAIQSACSVQMPLSDKLLSADSPEALASLLWHKPGFFWLDSAAASGATQDGNHWSYLSVNPVRVVSCKDRFGHVAYGDHEEVLGDSAPLDLLAKEWDALPLGQGGQSRSCDSNQLGAAPPFVGGWLALFGYDLAFDIENIQKQRESRHPFPDLHLARYDVVLAFNHQQKTWWACCLVPDDGPPSKRSALASAMIEEWLGAVLPASSRISETSTSVSGIPLARSIESNCSASEFKAKVSGALEYIAAGDIYQVNLSQQFNATWTESPIFLYQRLRQESPSSFSALISLGDGRWACSISPELFLSVRNGQVETRPIKGTRPRGASVREDQQLAQSLKDSTKDRAELTMIVDLERNDLGRVCQYGTVEVVSDGQLERHPTVFHRTATVRGQLNADGVFSDLFKATFPGGSITGAPKVRAMEIIEELESSRRGLYCGAIGWMGQNGDLTFNLPIRTALLDETDQTVWYQAGCGIVADSDPADEYEESLAKAKAFFCAVNGTYNEVDHAG